MKTYKLNNIEISENQIRELIKSHPELKEEKNKPWRAEEDGCYWRLFSDGTKYRVTDLRIDVDNYNYLTGNYSQTEAGIDAHKASQLAIGRVTHAILEANGEFDQSSYQLVITPNGKLDGYAHAKGVIFAGVLPAISSREVAEQIIKDHEADLKLIFNLN